MTVESDPLNQTTADVYAAVRSRIVPRLNLLAACRSERELLAHPVYRDLAPLVEEALATTYIADFRRGPAPARQRYRVVAWNIERGRQLPAAGQSVPLLWLLAWCFWVQRDTVTQLTVVPGRLGIRGCAGQSSDAS